MKIKVGDKVKHFWKTTDQKNRSVTKSRKGTVIGVYPHIFNVVFDGKHYSESFPYCLIDAKGNECVKVV